MDLASHKQVTGVTYGKSIYPEYDAADLGLPEYWYPALFSRQLRGRPIPLLLCGLPIVFVREKNRVYALHDRCPHRGIPLSMGKQEFPCTITCCYHGWTYDLKTGDLVAALTDGADSPICGSQVVRVRTFPVEDRAGIIWVYIGERQPSPVEEDIPEQMLRPGTFITGRISERKGDWRHAAENGFDEGHAKYLHRSSPWAVLRYLPAWSHVKIGLSADGKWLTRYVTQVGYRTDYPKLGVWPPKAPWYKLISGRKGSGGPEISIRMPCTLQVAYPNHWWNHIEWYVPTEVGRYRYFQFIFNRRDTAWNRFRLKVWYWLYLRWVFHLGLFNQDDRVIKRMQTPPERLYRPDVSIVGWRRYAMEEARGRHTASVQLDSRATGPDPAFRETVGRNAED